MKPARSIDLTAKTAEQLIEEFNIKVIGADILFWDKTQPPHQEREADITLPKIFFRDDVLKELERSFS